MDKMSLSEKLTYSTVLITCKHADGTGCTGTGFIINLCKNEEQHTCVPVIITNNHVIENSIETRYEFCLQNEAGLPDDRISYSVTYSGNGWIHHPDANIDLSCLPLAAILTQLNQRNVKVFYIPLETSLIPSQSDVEQLSAMEEVVMVGYPIGLADTYNHKPIIRKGITATHIKKDYQGKKEFLVDMACFPGSSGSPIFILNEGMYHIGNSVCAGDRISFIGILYAGPQYSATGELILMEHTPFPHSVTKIPTNLGIVIKAEKILEFEKMFNEKRFRNGENQ